MIVQPSYLGLWLSRGWLLLGVVWIALGSSGHFLWPIALTLSLKWYWLENNLGEWVGIKFGLGPETGSRTQVSLILSPEGRQEEPGDPFFTWSSSSQSMMAWSPVLFAIVILSIFSEPSRADRAMPKLADRKLCADEECSRKSQGTREGG